MKFKCELDNVKTLKKGMKMTLSISDKETIKVMKDIYNFMDKPIVVEILIDEQGQMERFKQIAPEQRRKIFAIIGDIAKYSNENKEYIRDRVEKSFLKSTGHEDFSLSNCSKELAADFIEYLIVLCFEMGVPLKDSPIDAFENVDRYLCLCLSKRVCAVCGALGEIHHVDAIGMGRDRRTVDDSDYRKICLCRKHHTEAHAIGMNSFEDKYHVHGVLWEG